MGTFAVDSTASFGHPAGRVHGKIVDSDKVSATLEVQRHGGMPPLNIKFTRRADGTFREAGKGPRSPKLEADG